MTVKEQSQEQTSLAKYIFLSICKSPATQETYLRRVRDPWSGKIHRGIITTLRK